MKIGIKHVKKIREDLNLDMIVIFGVDSEGNQHVATHGRTVADAKAAAVNGNVLKNRFHWPENLCNTKPLERICSNCDYWRRKPYREQDRDEGFIKGDCYLNPSLSKRLDCDRACKEFEPNC